MDLDVIIVSDKYGLVAYWTGADVIQMLAENMTGQMPEKNFRTTNNTGFQDSANFFGGDSN